MSGMPDEIVSAEIEPLPGQARAVAAAFARLGFEVLHIGSTVSAQAPRSVWEKVFQVSFEVSSKREPNLVKDSSIRYLRAIPSTLVLPTQLETLVSKVFFVEPPEYFFGY